MLRLLEYDLSREHTHDDDDDSDDNDVNDQNDGWSF